MARHAFADDLACRHIERSEQGCRAVTFIVVRHGAGTPLFERQPWLRMIEGLRRRSLSQSARTLPNLDLHLIVDNYSTHKAPAVQRWIKRHPRFKLHFIPTSSSWLNLVERLFAEITRQQIRRGVFHSVPELEEAIVEWINHRNANPKPFVWTATPKSITLKRNRAKKVLANLAAGCK
jgi:transposase